MFRDNWWPSPDSRWSIVPSLVSPNLMCMRLRSQYLTIVLPSLQWQCYIYLCFVTTVWESSNRLDSSSISVVCYNGMRFVEPFKHQVDIRGLLQRYESRRIVLKATANHWTNQMANIWGKNNKILDVCNALKCLYNFCISNIPKRILHVHSTGVWTKVLLSFSVYTNGKRLLSTSQLPGSITVIPGIRFLVMSWIVIGHAYSMMIFGRASECLV